VTGYIHAGYAESLREFGTPRELRRCGSWILVREIQGFPYQDAMGCYPLFLCQDWSQLQHDLEEIRDGLVCLFVVTDPFGKYDLAGLSRCFKDVVFPYKEHFITDLSYPINDIVSSKYNRKYARQAFKKVDVERCQEPIQFLDEWVALYDHLINQHNIKGLRAFSRTAFSKQLSIPGMVMFRALHEGATVGAHLWYVMGEVGYSHLSAYSPVGYELRASYALQWSAIEYFAGKIRWLSQGAGVRSDGTDGLSRFKRGWSTGTRAAYFCGRIFDNEKYWEIVKAKRIPDTDYFPAYRKGEFEYQITKIR